MSVELDALAFSRGHAQVQRSVGLQHGDQRTETLPPAVVVDRIAVPSESEMLQSVEAGKRIRDGFPRLVQIHHVELYEVNTRHLGANGSNVQYVDLPERCHVGHEPVDGRTHVDVALGCTGVDFSRNDEVLMEVVASGYSCVGVSVLVDRIGRSERKLVRVLARRTLPSECPAFSQHRRTSTNGGDRLSAIESPD